MIIRYQTYGNKYSTFLRIPDSLPWKLMVEMTSFDEEAAEAGEEDFICSYAVKLIAGGMEEVIIKSADCAIPEYSIIDNRDDEILDFLNYIVEEATSSLAYAEKNGEKVFDLGNTISICREEWHYQLRRAAEEVVKSA